MMRKTLVITLILIVLIVVVYSESRSFYYSSNGNSVTVWRMFNNVCYVIPGKYYGLLPPSDNYIKTSNTSLGVDFIWENNSGRVIVSIDEDAKIVNKKLKSNTIIDYTINKRYNDSLYTYLDSSLHVRRYKKGVDVLFVPIHNMGAL